MTALVKVPKLSNLCVSTWKHSLCSGTCFSGAAKCSATSYPTGVLCQKPPTASILRWMNKHRLGSILFYMGILFSAFDKKTTLHYWISSLNLAQAPEVLVLYISSNWDKPHNLGVTSNWIFCWRRRNECNNIPIFWRSQVHSLPISVLDINPESHREKHATMHIWSVVELFCLLFQIL